MGAPRNIPQHPAPLSARDKFGIYIWNFGSPYQLGMELQRFRRVCGTWSLKDLQTLAARAKPTDGKAVPRIRKAIVEAYRRRLDKRIRRSTS